MGGSMGRGSSNWGDLFNQYFHPWSSVEKPEKRLQELAIPLETKAAVFFTNKFPSGLPQLTVARDQILELLHGDCIQQPNQR